MGDILVTERPIVARNYSEVINILLGFELKLKEKNNAFFMKNKLLPWIQVIAHRENQIDCVADRNIN